MQIFTGVRMVQVNRHLVLRHLAYLRFHDLPINGVHRHNRTDKDALFVELAVPVEEHRLRQIHETFVNILAVGISGFKHEIECVARFLSLHRSLESRQHHLLALTPY